MKNQDVVRVEATVIKSLPNTRFEVELEHKGRKKRMVAHVSGKMRMYFIRILPGDTVTVELNRYDLNKPRIVYRGTNTREPENELQTESTQEGSQETEKKGTDS